jgi:hypothetical protein
VCLVQVGVIVLAFAAWVSQVAAADRTAGRPVAAPTAPDNPGWEVAGRGETAADAKKMALQRATEEVTAWLLQHGETLWTPGPGYLEEKNIVRQLGEPKRLEEDAYLVNLRVELQPGNVEAIRQVNRDLRMAGRQRLAAFGLGGFVVVLLVVTGFLRLEEATKGYHTTLLRLAALGILTGAGVLLWQLH